jgi:RND family efflux transporter MFP subunit
MLISPPEEEDVVAVDERHGRDRSRSGRLLQGLAQAGLMLAVLAGAYVLMNMLVDARPQRMPRVFQPTVYAVETVDAVIADNRPVMSLYGDVQAPRSVDIRPQAAGEIVAVHPGLRAGQRVERGDVLLEIDRFDYEGALTEARANLAQARGSISEIDARITAEREQLESAEVQLEIAESDLSRARSLNERGASTTQQLDERRLVVSQRQQAVSQRRNNLLVEQAQRAQQVANIERLEWLVAQAERNLANTEIRAPLSGVVSEATAEPGRTAGSSDIVASIYDDSELEARFTLTNSQYGRLATDEDPLIGRRIEATWTVGASSFTYRGTVDRIGATVAADRGGVEVFARLEPSDRAVQLRPGAFLEVTVPDRLYAESLRVPESALYDNSHVFVVADGMLQRRPVEVLAFEGADVVLAGDIPGGVVAGERVLVTRLTEADDGLPVRVAGERSEEPDVETTPPEANEGRRGGGRWGGGRGAQRAFGG